MKENEPVKRKRGRPPVPRPPPRQLAEADYAVERWKPWPRDPRVHVSDMGRVKSRMGRVLKPNGGKWDVEVGMGVKVKVKLLVWQAWVDDADNIAITHKDGDRTNCAVENLAAFKRDEFSAPKLSDEQALQCVEMYKRKKSCREIGAVFGVSDMTVHNSIRRLGLTAKEVRRKHKEREDARTKEMGEECLTVWREGLTWREVGRRLGVSHQCVLQRVQRAGHSIRKLNAERKDALYTAWAAALGIPKSAVTEKEKKLRQNYGITIPEYLAMKEAQGNKCKCGCPLGPERTVQNQATIGLTFPVVDHCHSTSDKRHAVRAILHAGCNSVVGMLREDREVFRKLGKYVEETRYERPMRPAPHTPGLPGLHH